jgi:hypothetical protein
MIVNLQVVFIKCKFIISVHISIFMRKSILGYFLILISIPAICQEKTVTYLYDAGATAEEKVIDIHHMNAHLKVNPFDTLVEGEVTFTFSPILGHFDSVAFWCPDLEFSLVEIQGMEINYDKRDDHLILRNLSPQGKALDEQYDLKMRYTSKPKYDLFFIGWNEPAVRSNKQVWAHRPFHWLPYYGDRLTVDMYITFDGGYKVFTNGVRESVKDNRDGSKTWHYRMYKEHPFFSTCLVIGDYDYLEWKTAAGTPLELCYYRGQEDHAEPTYRYTPEMFAFFENEFGVPYPYELYREEPVQDYLYGAMETTTATVFGDYLAVDERGWDLRNYVNVNAHELAHQWYGDCISHLRPADVWLTESFATYYAKKFEENIFGEDYYQNVRRLEFNEALEASPKDGFGVGHSRGGRARWYPKGSLVMDMMRDYLGEEPFKAAIKHYTEKNLFTEVETGEFLTAIYEATGQPMDWFFEQWVYRGGEPKYQVSWNRGLDNQAKEQTVVRVRQAHQVNDLVRLFKMPVNVDVYYEDGTKDRVMQWIDEEDEEVVVPNPSARKISFVLFDPGKRILKTIEFDKSFDEWYAQALAAEEMIDRYEALVALRSFPIEDKKQVLIEVYSQETFHLTRGEVIMQLLKDYRPEFDPIVLKALQDPDPLVRRAVLENTDIIPAGLQSQYEILLADLSYVNVEKSLDLLCSSFPEKTLYYLDLTKNETGWRGLNIRMKWLEIAIGPGQQREYIAELVEYASPRFEFETRMNAFQLLKRLNYIDKTSAAHLIDGYLYWNYKVSNSAKEVLQYFYQQNRGEEIINQALAAGPWPTGSKSKVARLLEDGK